MAQWIKEPDRPRAMRFKCPYCGDYCYDNFYADKKTIKCSYQYCPHCGKEIELKKKKQKQTDNKHRPLCLVRVFAYDVGVDLTCEDCSLKCEKFKEIINNE